MKRNPRWRAARVSLSATLPSVRASHRRLRSFSSVSMRLTDATDPTDRAPASRGTAFDRRRLLLSSVRERLFFGTSFVVVDTKRKRPGLDVVTFAAERLAPRVCVGTRRAGVKIEVLGQIELYFDRGNAYDFVSLVREVSPVSSARHRATTRFACFRRFVLDVNDAAASVCAVVPSRAPKSHAIVYVRSLRTGGAPRRTPWADEHSLRVQPGGDAVRVVPRHQREVALPPPGHDAAELRQHRGARVQGGVDREPSCF